MTERGCTPYHIYPQYSDCVHGFVGWLCGRARLDGLLGGRMSLGYGFQGFYQANFREVYVGGG